MINDGTAKLIQIGGVGNPGNYGNRGWRLGDTVYDIDGIAPTITSQPVGNTGGYSSLFIDMELIRCLRLVHTEHAKRIRKQYENHEIDFPRSQLQELEIRDDDCSNTITTVLKDNLIAEISDMETVKIKCANSQGFKECDVGGVFDSAFPSADRHSRVIDNGNIAPSLTAEVQSVCAVVGVRQATTKGYIECEIGGVANMAYPDSDLRRGRVIDKGQVSPTLQAGEPSICKIESPIAIRKLTPRECWRLMDFTDEQFDRAEKVNSSTQLYKQAGNSIVVACLEAIFSQLGIGEEWNKRDFDSDGD